jgi:hypothetical protein
MKKILKSRLNSAINILTILLEVFAFDRPVIVRVVATTTSAATAIATLTTATVKVWFLLESSLRERL